MTFNVSRMFCIPSDQKRVPPILTKNIEHWLPKPVHGWLTKTGVRMVTKFFVSRSKGLSDFKVASHFMKWAHNFFNFIKWLRNLNFLSFKVASLFLNFYELRGGFANYPDIFKGAVTRVCKTVFSYFDGVRTVFAKGGDSSGRGEFRPNFFYIHAKVI